MTTFYEKHGRRYRPVLESDTYGALPQGTYLLTVHPGGHSLCSVVDLDYVPLLAAALPAREAMIRAAAKASEARPRNQPITPQQQAAWEAFAEVMGEDLMYLDYNSLRTIVDAGLEALIDAARAANPQP